MHLQQGFTLIELMVVIAIIAILSAIGIPAYQGYMQKAALTNMLQSVVPYKMAIELCIIDQGTETPCSSGSHSIPPSSSSRYISQIQATAGQIKFSGQQALKGLNITMTPTVDNQAGGIAWSRSCSHSSNVSMVEACNNVFRFDDAGDKP